MNYTIIALVFVVLIMIYIGYSYATNTALIKSAVYLPSTGTNSQQTISWDKLTNPGSSSYHYSGWLYLKENTSNQAGEIPLIFHRGDVVASPNQFILGLEGQKLSIHTSRPITDGKIVGGVTGGSNPVAEIITDFPLQKWVYFSINVINGSLLECYINGKLVKSVQPPAALINLTPDIRAPLIIGGTNSAKAYITKFKREAFSLNADEVRNSYLEGNGVGAYTNWTGGYNASFSLYNAAGEIRKIAIL